MNRQFSTDKLEYKIIESLVAVNSTVLDLGCGNGELLSLLVNEKKVKAQGIEISEEAIYQCVAKGMSVFHGDIDTGLAEYGDKSFDYVILNQSMQQVRKPNIVLAEALRVGHKVIVGFPNFVYLPARGQIFFEGRTPVTESLPYRWYNTPNLHFLSIKDFKSFCLENKIKILATYYLGKKRLIKFWPNLLAQNAIFLITL